MAGLRNQCDSGVVVDLLDFAETAKALGESEADIIADLAVMRRWDGRPAGP